MQQTTGELCFSRC